MSVPTPVNTPVLDSLRTCKSLRQLAPMLGLKPAVLAMQLYTKDKRSAWYTSFEIKKRFGGVRKIHAPEQHLKMIQSRLSSILQDCQFEVYALNGHPEGPGHLGISHGFKRYHTIITNGREHIRRKFVFNLDLEDFFGSIHFGRVRAFFEKNKDFRLDPKISEILAHICCYNGGLPQGSPCSPVVSNLIAHAIDTRLAKLANKHCCTYTRYADDLTFSTNLPSFPAEIATTDGCGNKWLPGRSIVNVIVSSGFRINEKKTRMQYRGSRQEVTGLTVNNKVNVTATYRATTRAMASRLFKTGSFDFEAKAIIGGERTCISKVAGTPRQLLGRFTHIDQVDRFNEKLRKLNDIPGDVAPGRRKLFRDFLYFYKFYSISRPIIVCEGKTDNIYIKCAVKSMSKFFPALITASSPPQINVDFFKYSDRRSSEVMQMTGGVGGICHFIKNYSENLSRWFTAPRPEQPIIVIIDNDNGAESIYQAISGITKKPKPRGYAEFIHVVANLYVVPTPPLGKKNGTDIECFFTSDTLNEKINGKSFSKGKTIDESKEYGKAPFAVEVVAKKCATIDFSGFQPLLKRIELAIANYSKIK
jgi:hypothetical protein